MFSSEFFSGYTIRNTAIAEMNDVRDELGSMYADLPYNGLAASSDIILDQMKEYGIDLENVAEPDGADLTLAENVTSLTTEESALFDQRNADDERSNAVRDLMSQASVPIDKYAGNDKTTKLYETQSAPGKEEGKVFDGPGDKGNTFGDVLTSYGLPASIGEILSDAEEAFSGIIYDLNHINENRMSVYEILVKNNRLRGLGAIFVVIAVAGIILNNLFIRR